MSRIRLIADQLSGQSTTNPQESLTIKFANQEEGQNLPVKDSWVLGSDLAKLKNPKGDTLRLYDPNYFNTTGFQQRIVYSTEVGDLWFRGYTIEQLAMKSNILEVAYLLTYGELPTKRDFEMWEHKITSHNHLHQDILNLISQFPKDAHPMNIFTSVMAAHSTLYTGQNPALAGQDIYKSAKVRNKQIYRILGKVPTIAASILRHQRDLKFVEPRSDCGYVENFLMMVDNQEKPRSPETLKKMAKIFDQIAIMSTGEVHEIGTRMARHLSSAGVDVYSTMAGALGALSGIKNGAAMQEVTKMLRAIGSPENVSKYLEGVKNRKFDLFGYGHRVFRKKDDPRNDILRDLRDQTEDLLGKSKLVEISKELEKQVKEDPFFQKRGLMANGNLYGAVMYDIMGFPEHFCPVLLCMSRIIGWIAHWNDYQQDPEQTKIFRPRQNFVGQKTRDYVPFSERKQADIKFE